MRQGRGPPRIFLAAALGLLLPPVALAPGATRIRAGPGVAVLSYHHFVTDEEAARRPGLLDEMTMSRSQLVAQLDHMARTGATAIGLDDFLAHVRGDRPAARRSVLIMLDDGYESAHRIAWPIFRERGIPFTSAIIVVATESQSRWHALHPASAPHLSWGQIDEMLRPIEVSGVLRPLLSVVSHTFDHHLNLRERERRLAPAGRTTFHAALRDDLVRARQTIALRTAGRCRGDVLVWPHGGSSASLLAIAREGGHVATFTALGLVVRAGHDPMRLTRIHAGSGVRSLPGFERALRSAGW
jgi:peptidoglycan/xylan/chitin deacetylase (PgdA/CDA1 family)